ncbi:MAG: HalOD1 output domain-containing protein [Haloarculaceae archaeon]
MSECRSSSPPVSRTTDPDSLLVDLTHALAAARGEDPLELPALNQYVDVDGLLSLVAHGAERGTSCTVSFRVESHAVQVAADGTVSVSPVAAADAPVDSLGEGR